MSFFDVFLGYLVGEKPVDAKAEKKLKKEKAEKDAAKKAKKAAGNDCLSLSRFHILHLSRCYMSMIIT